MADKKATKTQPAAAEAAAVWVSIDDLRPWANNPRVNEKAVAKVMASLKRFGFGSPILARRENMEIIAGHTRWAAAKKLKMDRVPVRLLDLDPADAHLLAIADNRIGEEAEWDDEKLAAVLNDLRAQDVDLADSGLSDEEIEKLLADSGPPEEGPDTSAQLSGLTFQLLIECETEEEQTVFMEKIEALGIACKPLIV